LSIEFAETLDRVAQIRAQILQALGAEQHDHDEQDDQELPDADTTKTHDMYSVMKVYSDCGSRGFFRVAGEAETAIQFIQHGLGMLAEGGEHDQTVEPQIGGFVDQVLAVTAGSGVLGSEDGFHRLLANFFQNLVQTLVIQTGHVGAIGRCALARLQYFGQAIKRVTHDGVLHRWRADLSVPLQRFFQLPFS
jgi:hypothetical protein